MEFVHNAIRPNGTQGAPTLGPVYDWNGDELLNVELDGVMPDFGTFYDALVVTFPDDAPAGTYDVRICWEGNAREWFLASV